ncbi:DUF58 domain-containing protein [Hydrocarboniclastica marina]|uniref:DUF58 domain-containing protein n=2 Tax=Hydrocarboniclastica marina TaxID=2259620 RepID=A0A4P7XHS0_9ALTE|nr:DUF58 domain-containing protein [Hydrocarboniclastica marina]
MSRRSGSYAVGEVMTLNPVTRRRRRRFSLASPGRRPTTFWGRWLQRRLPAADEVELGRTNLFILPTREGALFLVLLGIMLLTGINYQNSLIYLLTFLLGAFYYVGILQTHSNLSGIKLSLRNIEEGFTGSALAVDLQFIRPYQTDRPAIDLFFSGGAAHIDVRDEGQVASLAFIPPHRGAHTLPRIRIESRYPFGLFKAWTYLWLKSTALAYPRPVEPPGHLGSGWKADGEDSRTSCPNRLADDFLLRPYRTGDLPQRVQWKRFARDGQMMVLEAESRASDSLWLDYDGFPGVPGELRLSYLSWLVESCRAQDRPFGLRLPGAVLNPAAGPRHAREAQRRLAMFQGATS